jgi:hypothetical protein
VDGAGATSLFVVDAGATLKLTHTPSKLTDMLLDNSGVVLMNTSGDIHVNGASVTNYGTFNIQSDTSIIEDGVNDGFVNKPNSALTKTGAGGATNFGPYFQNEGGTLAINYGICLAGPALVVAGCGGGRRSWGPVFLLS